MTGLRYPEDLEAWWRWEASRHRLRGLVARARTARSGVEERPIAHLLVPVEEPDVLVVVDVWSPSCRSAIGHPLEAMDQRRVAVLTSLPEVVEHYRRGRDDVVFTDPEQLPRSLRSILTLGSFNDLAGRVEPWARRHDVRYLVVQHGLLTPWTPPLNPGAHLLAWSEADADYWSAGRRDITSQVVGSQMLWQAALQPRATLTSEEPVMLGQLHGTELGRADKLGVYTSFCRRTGAGYRPHPNERDLLSRVQHRVMRRAGVVFEESGQPIIDLGRPVVSIFSTGTLEAAQRGLPAWVHHPRPTAWVRDFWHRYGLSPYGEEPTPMAPLPATEPAQAIARAAQR